MQHTNGGENERGSERGTGEGRVRERGKSSSRKWGLKRDERGNDEEGR